MPMNIRSIKQFAFKYRRLWLLVATLVFLFSSVGIYAATRYKQPEVLPKIADTIIIEVSPTIVPIITDKTGRIITPKVTPTATPTKTENRNNETQNTNKESNSSNNGNNTTETPTAEPTSAQNFPTTTRTPTSTQISTPMPTLIPTVGTNSTNTPTPTRTPPTATKTPSPTQTPTSVPSIPDPKINSASPPEYQGEINKISCFFGENLVGNTPTNQLFFVYQINGQVLFQEDSSSVNSHGIWEPSKVCTTINSSLAGKNGVVEIKVGSKSTAYYYPIKP